MTPAFLNLAMIAAALWLAAPVLKAMGHGNLVVFFVVLLMAGVLSGVPIAFSLGLASTLTILFFTNDSRASMSLKLFDTMEHYTLLAIPFFILASAFLTTGGVARRLIRFAIAAVGHLRGGLATCWSSGTELVGLKSRIEEALKSR